MKGSELRLGGGTTVFHMGWYLLPGVQLCGSTLVVLHI